MESFLYLNFHLFGLANVTKRAVCNFSALMKNDGSYIINGNWVVDQPGKFIDCGTVFTYHQNPDGAGSMKEYVYSPGPTNQPIQLMVSLISYFNIL